MLQVPHVLQQDLEAYLTRLIPTEDDSVIEEHLSKCKSCVARLTHWDDFSSTLHEVPGFPDGYKEKRRNPRFATYGSAVLQILNPFSVEHLEIYISDVCKEGMRLKVPIGVQRGSLVKVRIKKCLFFGEAGYCEPTSDSLFYVGVKLHEHGRLVSSRSL
jgi:hypothetical protein